MEPIKDKCKICDRKKKSNSEYCMYHQQSLNNLKKAHKTWSLALDITWPEFLSQVVNNTETGDWAKEVAEYFMKTGPMQTRT